MNIFARQHDFLARTNKREGQVISDRVRSGSAYTAVCNTSQIGHIAFKCGQVVDDEFTEVTVPGRARQYGH